MKKTSKKILSALLAIIIVFSVIPIGTIESNAAESWLWPLENYKQWTTYEGHRGIDIPAPSGTPIRASKSGTLYVYNNICNGSHLGATPACTISGCNSDTGKCVYIIHNDGTASCYMHLVSLAIATTRTVKQGDIIGYVGTTGPSTGNHLHFEAASGSGSNYWSYSLMNPGNLSYIYNTNVPATGISINATQFTMDVGESKTITATVSPSNATNKNVTWSSNLPEIATVSNGKITGVSAGACTITAKTANGKTASCLVVVFPKDAGASAFTSYNEHYYELYDYPTSWYDAKEFCESHGGHLVTITSAQENEAVSQLAKKGTKSRYYIGCTDEKTEGTFEWITGEPFAYRNFADGEPNSTAQAVSEDYLFMHQSNGLWGDIINYQANPNVTGFICEYDVPKLKANAVTVIDERVYELYDRNYTIDAAGILADEQGGYLLSLTSAQEQTAVGNWVKANSKAPYISLGATDAETEGVWKWTSGEKWSYTSWLDGEPNNSQGIEDSAVWAVGSGKWNDVSELRPTPFIIEYTLDMWLKQGHSLSEIVLEELPDGADPNDYEIATEYRSRDKSTTTSTAASMDGWTKYDSKITYGAWSKVQSSKTKPADSDTLQNVGTWTQYHYYHYLNYYSGCYNIDSISYGTNKGKHDIYINNALSAVSMADQGGKQAYGYYTCSEESPSFNIWFYAGSTLFYNYQTRTKTTTNYFYKWSDWSDWSKTPVSATETKEVETRVVYKLKDKPAPTLSAISVQTMPSKTTYTAGDKFDASGLIVKATMSDGTSKILTSGFTVSSPNMSTVGTKTVTVSYGGKTTSFSITVKAPVVISSISVQNMPSKTTYTVGDKFDASGLTVKATMSDGTFKILTSGFTVSSPDMSTVGTKTVTVSYGGKTTSFAISVIKTEIKKVSMHRLYNPNSGEHFYTADENEKNNLVSVGWKYEGIGWTAPETSDKPVYRLYNQNGGEHHYTLDASERDFLVSLGWKFEDIGWYSADTDGIPLYRQYNPNAFANNHNYTADKSENDWLVSLGWKAEGIGWYGVA